MNLVNTYCAALVVIACLSSALVQGYDKELEGTIKYVKADALTSGNGSKDAPFKTLADAEADQAHWDVLVVLSSQVPLRPEAPFNLLSGKKLIGEESPVDTNLSSTQPTIAPKFTGDLISVTGKATIKNLLITNVKGAAINYSNATDLIVKNVEIRESTAGLSGEGTQSGKTELTHVTINNVGTGVKDMLSTADISRELIICHSQFINTIENLETRTIGSTSSAITIQDSIVSFGTVSFFHAGRCVVSVSGTTISFAALTCTTELGGSFALDIDKSTLLNSQCTVINSGQHKYHLRRSSTSNFFIQSTNNAGGSAAFDFIGSLFKNGNFIMSNEGEQSLYGKKTSFINLKGKIDNGTNCPLTIEYNECSFLNGFPTIVNAGQLATTIKKTSLSFAHLDITNSSDASSSLLVSESSFSDASLISRNFGKETIEIKKTSFTSSSHEYTNDTAASSSVSYADCTIEIASIGSINSGNQTIAMTKNSCTQTLMNFDTKVGASSSLSLNACNLLISSLDSINEGTHNVYIKESRLDKGDGIFSTNSGKFDLTVDSCHFNNITDGVGLHDSNGTTDVKIRHSVFSKGDTLLNVTVEDADSPSSSEKISIEKTSIDAEIAVNLKNRSSSSSGRPLGFTEVTLKEVFFRGSTITAVNATSPWELLKINATHNCFKTRRSFGDAAFFSSGSTGKALITAHNNSFSNFSPDIEDQNSGIIYDMSDNWWGHDPIGTCTQEGDCETYQTCINTVCEGPLVSTPFAGIMMLPINPRKKPTACPDFRCKDEHRSLKN